MSLRISGKHMELGDSFRTLISSRVSDAVDKYFDGGFSGHVTVEKAGSRYSADCNLHLDSGVILQAEGHAQDPQVAFDQAAERIEKRLRRYKRKLKDRHIEHVAVDDISYTISASGGKLLIGYGASHLVVVDALDGMAEHVLDLDSPDVPLTEQERETDGNRNGARRINEALATDIVALEAGAYYF